MTEIFNTALEIIANGLKSGEQVKISPLGSFKPVVREKRKARNVWAGEEIILPKRKTVTFKPSPQLTEIIEEGS